MLCTTLRVALAQGSSGEIVPLETKLPKPQWDGRGSPLKLPNLEPIGTLQKPLLVPPGLKNVALGQIVTSSDQTVSQDALARVTDGAKESTNKTFVELGPLKQWIQIDLERETEIFGIWLWHLHHNPRVYIDVVAQVSNDENFASGKEVTVYNNDDDSSSGLAEEETNATLRRIAVGSLMPPRV